MSLKAVFMFLDGEANPEIHQSTVQAPGVELLSIAVANYEQAAATARELAAAGYGAIELCGGFGIAGVAAVKEAVPDNVAVGVVRFDNHPGLGNQSGDQLFA